MNNIVTIEKFDNQGRGIAHLEDRILFVENALPGETVKVKITKTKKKIAEAIAVEVIEKSERRVEPPCPYYESCGGCDLMHLSYQNQLSYKEQKVRELMIRYANIEEEKIKKIVQSEPLYYRNKITLQVKETIGFYKKKSYEIIPIDHCKISDPKINQILSILTTFSFSTPGQIMIRSRKDQKETMIVFDQLDVTIENLESLKPLVTSIVKRNHHKEEVLFGNGVIHENIGKYEYVISPSSFFQVNTLETEALYTKVKEYAHLTGTETVFDLYCGTGTIGIFISDQAKKVLGIEVNQDAIKNANKNKERNRVSNIEFLCGDVANLIDQVKLKPDVVIVDPPRAGLDSHTIQVLESMNPNRIVYVSCDPFTLARDLKLLQECYQVEEITPVDMFPQTYHVECVVSLVLK